MRALLDRLSNPLHLLIALAATWLVASSPWIGMYRWLPDEPGFVNLSHVALGLALLPLGLAYAAACLQGGRWRSYFPWLAGDFAALGRDLAGLARGERPMSEGGGLFAAIEGLLLLALLAAAVTGAGWYAAQNTGAALAWRAAHLPVVWCFAGLLLGHVVAVSLHLVDLVRD
jgi:hypothetical protein